MRRGGAELAADAETEKTKRACAVASLGLGRSRKASLWSRRRSLAYPVSRSRHSLLRMLAEGHVESVPSSSVAWVTRSQLQMYLNEHVADVKPI